ncbi:hypothetical protein ES319_D07G017700v1 [Gossypium barbadense]|uniref:Uncharacterized protein n=1 Tax=Gossypium barbadense TaxID=3634 RepID=A0A5J5QLA7_GOSBA|nr:hypothetical protein ES319_D07G017700v1 [Gossypium barbadense]
MSRTIPSFRIIPLSPERMMKAILNNHLEHPQIGQQRTNKRNGGSRLYLRGKRLKMISPQSKPWQAASDYEGPRTETHLVTEPIEGTLIICFQGYGIENCHQIILFQCISYPSKFLEHIRNWRD